METVRAEKINKFFLDVCVILKNEGGGEVKAQFHCLLGIGISEGLNKMS